jgi:hypothetical protein
MRQNITAALTGFWLCCALFFGWMFYERYWRLLDCFNELGRCFDPTSDTVATDSNFVYGLMACAGPRPGAVDRDDLAAAAKSAVLGRLISSSVSGAGCVSRTRDFRVTRAALCRLS